MSATHDRFGNPIDPSVGYARGAILHDSLCELRRRLYAMERFRALVQKHGRASILNFTGHHREFPVEPGDIAAGFAEEWIGQTLVHDELSDRARRHLGGSPESVAAVFNRSAACIVSLFMALTKPGERVLAIAPRRRSHVSLRRGAALAGASLVEADANAAVDWHALADIKLVIVTRVTSELDVLPESSIRSLIEEARGRGKTIFVDDAYGAQLAPAVLNQARPLEYGAHAAVTSCDKAGLLGPRAGLMVGAPSIIEPTLARASEIGFEGRAPLALGVLSALRKFQTHDLIEDCRAGESLSRLLADRLGENYVQKTVMGPLIDEQDILEIALASSSNPAVVPAEASCLLARLLMEEHGMLTSNVAERPGARVSLRLRPIAVEVERFGGAERIAEAIVKAFDRLRLLVHDGASARHLILGPAASA